MKALQISPWRLAPASIALKRAIDVIASFVGLLLFAPVFLFLAVLIRLNSRGPALYRQARIGRGGQPFLMLKFRTMHLGSEEQLFGHLGRNSSRSFSYDRFQKLADDPRLTSLGRFLRRSSLDELPQLWNVLLGDMSLVGPRPFLPEQTGSYSPCYAMYVLVRPGMTGLWQVSGRNRLSFAERVRLDEAYFRSWSFWLDIHVLWRTVGAVLRQDGAY